MWTAWILAIVSATPLTPRLEVDVSKSELLAFIKPDSERLLSGLAHEHVLEATRWTASFSLDPESLADCQAELVIDVEGLVIDAPALRERQGWDPISEDDRKEIRATMLGEGQLDAERHPKLRFEVTRCRVIDADSNKYFVDGRLSVRGKTRDKGAYVTLEKKADGLRAQGELTLRQSRFGYEPYSAALGTIKNADLVRITFSLALGQVDGSEGGRDEVTQ